MFTGIVEEIGKIQSVNRTGSSAVLSVGCTKVIEGTKLGDSIAVNGVCLTVIAMNDSSFSADISYETLDKSSMRNINNSVKVNLERALTLNTRLGGHMVSGHVDAVGIVKYVKPESNSYVLGISFPGNISKYIAVKGSITIDGISLTVAEIRSNILEIAVIPHTFENTTLMDRKAGASINIEVDQVARYIEKLLINNNQEDQLSAKMHQLYDLEDL